MICQTKEKAMRFLIPVRFVYSMAQCGRRYQRTERVAILHPAPGPCLPRLGR